MSMRACQEKGQGNKQVWQRLRGNNLKCMKGTKKNIMSARERDSVRRSLSSWEITDLDNWQSTRILVRVSLQWMEMKPHPKVKKKMHETAEVIHLNCLCKKFGNERKEEGDI